MLPKDHLWTSQVWLGNTASVERVGSYRPERCSFALFFRLLQQPLPHSSP